MKKYVSILLLSIFVISMAFSQGSMNIAPVSTTFSQNGIYSIQSFSYDGEFPTLRGKSIVYKNGEKLYSIERAFDLYKSAKYCLIISNDGSAVAYLTNEVYNDGDEFKNVTIYKNGKLVKTYSQFEFTGCNSDEIKCNLFYENFFEVVDTKKSNYGTPAYKKVYKDSASEKEIFLNENYVLPNNDTIYSIDSRRIVTEYELKKMQIIRHVKFDEIYPQIKSLKKQESKIEYVDLPNKYINDFVDKKTGKVFSSIISEISGLKYVSQNDKEALKYKLYRIQISGYLNHEGSFEIETFKCDEKLNKKQIMDYIANNKFTIDFLPEQIEKQYFKYFFGGYRNFNDSIAEQETVLEKENNKKEFERRIELDSVQGVYIPKDLEDCFVQLDKILKNIDKDEIRNLNNSSETIRFHLGLGMWIRNNWGLWGGSRLLKYFRERGISHPDNMSAIILACYYNWLKGDKQVAKDWEKHAPIKDFKTAL